MPYRGTERLNPIDEVFLKKALLLGRGELYEEPDFFVFYFP